MNVETNKELGGWISMANDHWQEHRPNMYRELVEAGKLQSALEEAAKQTALELDQLMEAGWTYHSAWEAVRETYLLLPQEEDEDEAMSQIIDLHDQLAKAEAEEKGWAYND